MRVAWLVVTGLAVAGAAALLHGARRVPLPPARAVDRGVVGAVWRGGAPAAGARVELRVDVPSGEGTAAAYVEASPSPLLWTTAVLATTTADDHGRYSFPGVGGGTYSVVASDEEGAVGSTRASIGADGAIVEAHVGLSRDRGVVRGRFVDDEPARPRPTVLVWANDWRVVPGPSALSGRFRVEGASRFGARLTAHVPGRWRVGWALSGDEDGGETVCRLPAPTHEARGRVVARDTGAPVPGAQVVGLASVRDAQEAVAATSDAEGRFRLATRLGPPKVVAWAPGFGRATAVRATDGDEWAAALPRLARLEGRVTDAADGTPVAGAVVEVRPVPPARIPPPPARTTRDGRFAIDGLGAGPALVTARGGGVVSPGLLDVRDGGFNPFLVTLEDGRTATRDLTAVTGARLRGSVRTADGRPVRGATVRIACESPEPSGPLGIVPEEVVATDAEGVFRVEDLPPGAWVRVHVSAAGAGDVRSGPWPLRPGETVCDPLVLPGTRVLLLHVVDAASGDGVEAAEVRVVDGPDGSLRDTADDGWVVLRAFPATAVRVRVAKAGYTPSAAWAAAGDEHVVAPPPSSGPWTAIVRLTRQTARPPSPTRPAPAAASGAPAAVPSDLSVRVVDPQGTPVPWADAALRSADRVRWALPTRTGARLERKDVAGTATLEVWGARTSWSSTSPGTHLPLGPWRGTVAPETTEVTVRLPPERRIEGFVRDESGHGVLGALVLAFPDGEGWDDRRPSGSGPFEPDGCLREIGDWREARLGIAHGLARTDDRGAFSVGGLGDLDYEVWVVGPPEAVRGPHVRARAGSTGVVVTVRPALSARVTVLDAAGRPVPGATVSVVDPAGAAPEPVLPGRPASDDRACRADAEGVAWLRGLEPGRVFTLVVRPPDPDPAGRGERATTVPAWTPADTVVRLDAAAGAR